MSLSAAFARHGLLVKDTEIRGWLEFGSPVRLGRKTVMVAATMGAYSYAEQGAEIAFAKVGPYCSIGRDVRVGLSMHTLDAVSTHPFIHRNYFPENAPDYPGMVDFEAAPAQVAVGGDVWIGTGAMVVGQKPTRIGSGAVIAAGSVVTKDVEPYTIVGGNPARVLRRRFPDGVCEALLETEWWAYDLPRYGADNPQDAPALDKPEAFLDWWRDGGGERLRSTPRLETRHVRVGLFNDAWRLQRHTPQGWVREAL